MHVWHSHTCDAIHTIPSGQVGRETIKEVPVLIKLTLIKDKVDNMACANDTALGRYGNTLKLLVIMINCNSVE